MFLRLKSLPRRRRRDPAPVRRVIVLVVGALLMTSCAWGSPPDQVVVQPGRVERYLPNPGIGWVESPAREDSLFPQTVEYVRRPLAWAALNPAPGVFDTGLIDEALRDATAEGRQLAFRVYTMRGEDLGGHLVPDWLVQQSGVVLPSGEPDYGHCAYQAAWSEMVEHLRREYDGEPAVAWIDISGYGNFNEWSWQEQTRWEIDPSVPTTVDGMARTRLADMFIGGVGVVSCRDSAGDLVRQAYSYPGFHHSQLLMPTAGIRQSSEYVATRRPDVGIRHDCLGSPANDDWSLDPMGEIVARVWRRAPVVYEFCQIPASDLDLLAGAADLLRRTHATAVRDNLEGPRDPALLEPMLRDVGYRYAIERAAFPASVGVGDTLEVEQTWVNEGYAPSYPKAGQRFTVELGLRERGGEVVHRWSLDEDVSAWMPQADEASEVPLQDFSSSLRLPLLIKPGRYVLTAAILDQRTGDRVLLASEGRAEDGWYDLGPITVTLG